MTHTYQITGMTCSGCEKNVSSKLAEVPGVTAVEVSMETNSGTITMDKHINLDVFQQAIGGKESKYQISMARQHETVPIVETETRSWAQTYRPILLIFGYISAITLLIQSMNTEFNYMEAMRHFMAGFFLVFSFFKFLDLKGFAESYVMYDVLARKVPAWAYLYAFVELGLGVANVIDFSPIVTNAVTLVVMSVSIIGVLQSVLNKKKIQCACLGAVFNLPMSTVTIIEDALMIAMSGAMLLLML